MKNNGSKPSGSTDYHISYIYWQLLATAGKSVARYITNVMVDAWRKPWLLPLCTIYSVIPPSGGAEVCTVYA